MTATRADHALIEKIGARATQWGACTSKLDTMMDITATHLNGCPLDLQRLLDADDGSFAHDVFGIARHLDRDTCQLGGCFLPRFASKVSL